MTNSTAIATTRIDYLIPLQTSIAQYMLPIVFILGNFSNLANIFVFLQKDLRASACSWYFIAVSLGHLVFLYFGCLNRVISVWTTFDLTRTSLFFCKLRAYSMACGLLASRHFLSLISIDRWMVTSRHGWLRRRSSLHVARWMTGTGVGLSLTVSLCMAIWYRIEGSRGCVGATDTLFPLFYTVYNLATILVPFVIMLVFSSLILFNVRQASRRTGPASGTGRRTNYHRKDVQLIKLSFIQGIVYILGTSLYAYNGTYSFVTATMIKTHERIVVDGFLASIGINISYLYMAVSQFELQSKFKRGSLLVSGDILHLHVGIDNVPKRVLIGLSPLLLSTCLISER